MIPRNILVVCCLLCLLNFDQRSGTATATVNGISSTSTAIANTAATTNGDANVTTTATAISTTNINATTPANGAATPTPTPSPPTPTPPANGSATPTPAPSPPTLTPPSRPPPKGSRRYVVALATGISAGIGIIACLVIWYCIRQFNKRSKQNLDLEAAIKQYASIAPKRYSYGDIKKMTNSFKDKLGDGGCGDVYKGYLIDNRGYLIDNRPVAVKVLNTSEGSGEEFINEVASISRTFHVNIVTLLGFCLDGQKRALIYEFMPNGSLERYIHAETDSVIDGHLGWKKLYQIALGIARGLEYLHRGCTPRIVHFDIKPHNILLDEDFCPKISDFGLSKLCTRKESTISMPGARGTIGYIAPEVVDKKFGDVSHKSDVYSYGMMLLEMVGGRKNIKIEVSHTSEIYFPHLVYQRIELDEDLKLQGEMTPEEDEIARKMILVGLWCIQADPSRRPAVSKAIEWLEGSLQALEIPPKPVFVCPSTSPENFSIAIVVS